MVKKVFIKHKFRGVHGWENCPFTQVKFLKDQHHHQFEVTLQIQVTDSDRQVQFIKMQHLLEQIIVNLYPNYNKLNYSYDVYAEGLRSVFPQNTHVPYTAFLNNRSCEMICQQIIEVFNKISPSKVTITVSQDGHYGGTVSN